MPKASRSNSSSIGIDIVEIDRIREAAKRRPRFLSRVFSKEELAYCQGKSNPWPHFAVRFAAKEAVWKTLGPKNLVLKDISVSRSQHGEPKVLIKNRPASNLKLSLSHSRDYALAVAIKIR